MDKLAKIEWEAGNLRHCVTVADFAGAEAAAARYMAQVGRTISDIPPDLARTTIHDACALLEWARRNMCAARASLATRLDALNRLAAYAPPLITESHAFTLRA